VTIVFDLDGTLVDSGRDLAESASELVQSYGAPALPVQDVLTMVGEGAAMLVRRALERSRLDPETPGALARFLEIYDRRLLESTVAYPGMHEALSIVARHGPLAVLTNKPAAPSRTILASLGLLGFFADVIGGDSRYGRKPDPSGLRALTATEAGRGVLVGDSPIDAATAAAADCPFVFARYGFGAGRFGGTPPATTLVIDHPRELVAAIERVASGRP
jgi:phosphoglycolate phosphatase